MQAQKTEHKRLPQLPLPLGEGQWLNVAGGWCEVDKGRVGEAWAVSALLVVTETGEVVN